MKPTAPFHPAKPLMASALALAAASAAAETSPYYIGASLGYYHASNVFRAANSPNSDNVTNATLLAGVDQNIGRQRLFGDVSVQRSTYQNNSQLDNTGYSYKAGLDWATIERLSGQFLVNNRRSLADYNANAGATAITGKNIEDNRQALATVRLGLVTAYSAEASYEHRTRSFSAPEYQRLEYSQNAASLGLYYRPSAAWRLGVAARHTKGESPYFIVPTSGPAIADEYTRKDIDFTAQWNATGSSSLFARLSRSRSTHSASSSRDLSGLTGSLVWVLAPGGRWSLTSRISRDSGAEAYYLGVANLTSDMNQVVRSAQTQLSYEITGKLFLDAGLSYSQVKRTDDLLASNSTDSNRGYNLGLRWKALRNVELGCTINQQNRGSTVAAYAYDARSYGCYVQGMLR